MGSLVDLSKTKIDRTLYFSDAAIQSLKELEATIMEMFSKSTQAIQENDATIVSQVFELEEKVDELTAQLVNDHIQRLEEGSCTVEAGVIFIDIINYLERIADHVYKHCREICVNYSEPKTIE